MTQESTGALSIVPKDVDAWVKPAHDERTPHDDTETPYPGLSASSSPSSPSRAGMA
jgi:hypothetical protein